MSEHLNPALVAVVGLDHIVLRCHDIETTLAWYVDVLGLAPVRVDEWRAGTAPFPSVRVDAETIIDLVSGNDDSSGALDHLCLVVEPTDLTAVAASGRFTVLDGPGTRYGARGDGTSLYVSDPDGTTVELRHY
jgi:catechol 2,3-dioxygenase-like lactoylglutathione lyase family enzyme